MHQVEISFQNGLTSQFPAFRDVVKAAVYGCGRALKVVAADLDMTSSELSRKLGDNPNDPVNFPLHLLPELITATGDKRPVYWLIETFLEDDKTRKARAMEEIGALLPQLQALLRVAG